MLAGIFVSVHGAEPDVEHVKEATMTVRRAALEQEQRSLRAALHEAERQGRDAEILPLSKRKQEIDLRLRQLD